MKIKITRTKEPNGECWFRVKTVMPNGKERIENSLSFKEGEPKDSIWNEAANLATALTIAHRLEQRDVVKEETIVYETPETPETSEDKVEKYF